MKYFCTPEKGIAMKIARIVLTASILLSLKSTLFCSSEKATETILAQEKKPGYDASKKGWSKTSDEWMLENMGSDYSHYGTLCQVRPESDNEDETKSNGSKARWTKIGETKVKNLKDAQTFLKYTEKLKLSEQATAKSNSFIATENQRIADERAAKIAAGNHSFIELNQASKALVQTYFEQKTVTRPATKKTIQKKYQDLCNAELKQFSQACQATDAQTAQQLQDNLKRLLALKAAHNSEFTELKDQITKMPFVQSEQALFGKGLAKTGLQYKNWTPKAANSYADAAKGTK